MHIRAAQAGDVPQMRALEQHSLTAAHWAEREYDALFSAEAPRRIALVAVGQFDAQRLQGFIIARCAPQECEIENVVVARERRRRGVGSALVVELLDRAQAEGVTSVLLEVRESNLSARRLYEKTGFSEEGRRSNYYRNPVEDALLLRQRLQILRQPLEAE
jgi:[ribosomal protein S18]-alanine N-acetyltransferase